MKPNDKENKSYLKLNYNCSYKKKKLLVYRSASFEKKTKWMWTRNHGFCEVGLIPLPLSAFLIKGVITLCYHVLQYSCYIFFHIYQISVKLRCLLHKLWCVDDYNVSRCIFIAGT